MTDVIIIGGGFAGLSAATSLAEHGLRVTVLEGRRRLGGRAYSFRDDATGDVVDNGQHLFMACYHETRRLLARIGTERHLRFQPDLRVDFRTPDGQPVALKCPRLPAPYHLLAGFASLSPVSIGDIFRLRHIMADLATADGLSRLTVSDWLRRRHQSDAIVSNFWTPLTVAALNESPGVAAAGGLAAVLRLGFMGRREDARLGLSTVGLSDLYAEPARGYIEIRGGEVRLGAPVARLDLRGDRCHGVALQDGTRLGADNVISAVPHNALIPLLPDMEALRPLQTSPIVSINVWFDRPVMPEPFAGLLGTACQWAFNRSMILNAWERPCVAVVISAARSHVRLPQRDLVRLAVNELRRMFPDARSACVTRAFAVKERDATLSAGVGVVRPKQQSPWRNLFLAGDWTDTGLPATVESAVLSGHRCAGMILS